MTISLTRLGLTLVLGNAFLLGSVVSAQDSPHWDKSACATCHVESATVGAQGDLRASDSEALCGNCHDDRSGARHCRHVSNILPENLPVADELLPHLKGGEVVCTTCHDIVYQCRHPTAHYAAMNRGFLRARPSYKTSDFCMQCHDSANYQKLNPHAGVAGSPPKPTCQLCHSEIPETGESGTLTIDFNMRNDLNDVCLGCHDVKPHPKRMTFGGGPADAADWVHFVRPSDAVSENMRKSQQKTGIALPLNSENGEVFCATCHSPHDFKKGGQHGAQAPTPAHRLRLNNICQACHDK